MNMSPDSRSSVPQSTTSEFGREQVRGSGADPASPIGAGASAPGIDLGKMRSILRRRRQLIVGCILVGTLIATALGLQITPRYTATALLLIEPSATNAMDIQTVPADVPPPDPAAVETHMKALDSLGHMQRVLEQLDLASDPDLLGKPGRLTTYASRLFTETRRQLADWLPTSTLMAIGFSAEMPARLSSIEASAPVSMAPHAITSSDEIIQRFAANLQVIQEGRSNIIGVSFTSTNPETAARVANGTVELYVRDQVESKRAELAKASSWLEERAMVFKGEVTRAETMVEEYRAANHLASGRRIDIVDQQVADLSRELLNNQADLSGRQARLNFINELRQNGQRLDTLPEVLSSPVIIQLRQREGELAQTEAELATTLGYKHPSMRLAVAEREKLLGKIEGEIDRIVANLENEINIAKARVETTQAALAAAQRASSQAQTAEIRLHELEREAESDQKLYGQLLQRGKEVKEQQESMQPTARVVSKAIAPARPSSPSPPVFAAAGFIVSTSLSIMLALFLDQLDYRLRSVADIQAILGPCRVSFVPRLKRLRRQRPHEYLLGRLRSAYAESMRAILTALRQDGSHEARLPKIILVTSSAPNEGKTVLTVSLAAYAARSGRRVALLDLDLRHPSIVRELQISGKADVVDHPMLPLTKIFDDRLQLTVVVVREWLDPMPLLTSQQFEDFLGEMRRQYDCTFIDCSPILGIVDAQLLAPRVDKILFVVRWAKTPRTLVRSALNLLHDARANIGDVVFTQVNVRQHALYRYGDAGEFYDKFRKYYEN